MIYDTHCHLDLFDKMETNIHEVIDAKQDIGIFAVGTTPYTYEKDVAFCQKAGSIRIGLGLHPQLVLSGYDNIQMFCDYAKTSHYIGEIGLDFSSQYINTKQKQIDMLKKEIEVCEQYGQKSISIHARKSVDTVLEILGRNKKSSDNIYILHWFTGTQSQLKCAVEMGCFFSINQRMLTTKSGVAIIKALPINRILLESDAPFTGPIDHIGELIKQLNSLQEAVSKIKEHDISAQVTQNSILVTSR